MKRERDVSCFNLFTFCVVSRYKRAVKAAACTEVESLNYLTILIQNVSVGNAASLPLVEYNYPLNWIIILQMVLGYKAVASAEWFLSTIIEAFEATQELSGRSSGLLKTYHKHLIIKVPMK